MRRHSYLSCVIGSIAVPYCCLFLVMLSNINFYLDLGVITATSLLKVLTIWEEELLVVHQQLDTVNESLRQAEVKIEQRVEERTFELLQTNVRLQEE
jgi:C4-dicarboxylate-specific signal transduction histidine kinase